MKSHKMTYLDGPATNSPPLAAAAPVLALPEKRDTKLRKEKSENWRRSMLFRSKEYQNMYTAHVSPASDDWAEIPGSFRSIPVRNSVATIWVTECKCNKKRWLCTVGITSLSGTEI